VKAIQYDQYGSPDVVQYREVATPIPKDDEVLVRVRAASASAFDWHLVRGAPFLARLSHGLRRPKAPQLGADFAGTVQSVGSLVTKFNIGDAVFGERIGSFAEYVCVPEVSLVEKPANVSFESAATLTISGVTALQSLREMGHIREGQTVLVNGASGGVGTFAVQIAKSFGAEVTGVCSTHNLDLVRSLGADHVIDYTREDFTRSGRHFDLIVDAVGNHSVSDYRRALNPHGICVVVGFTTMSRLLRTWIGGTLISRKAGKQIRVKTIPITHDGGVDLAALLESGKVVPVVDRRFPLKEVARALEYLETGHARGKVVITIGTPDESSSPIIAKRPVLGFDLVVTGPASSHAL
jgi:NADPH:quinone reductase-like Zn-dependent oxidoreductase